MATQSLTLLDQSGAKLASVEVSQERDLYRGTIDVGNLPRALAQLFAEFEECVEGQMFTHADEIEAKIADLHLRVAFPDRTEAEATDLQVFPSTKRVSFKTRNSATRPHPILDDATPIKELV